MTRRPISTISFNTPLYLESVLKDIECSHNIQSWLYIEHKAEQDTTKNHIHLMLIPSTNVDPVYLRKLFAEPVSDGKPLGCLPFHPSKIDDWILYVLHNSAYLIKKGIFRLYTYQISDVHSNEPPEFLENIYNSALESILDSRLSQFKSRLDKGEDFGEILASGLVPPNQVLFYKTLAQNYIPKKFLEKKPSTHENNVNNQHITP